MWANNNPGQSIGEPGAARRLRACHAKNLRSTFRIPGVFVAGGNGVNVSPLRRAVLCLVLTLHLPLFASADTAAVDTRQEPAVSESVASEPAGDSAMPPATAGEGSLDASWVNAFGVTVLQALLDDPRDANVLLSPLSLATALTMAAQGAEGPTADAYARVLGYGANDAIAAAQALGGLGRELQREHDDLILRQGNGLWLAPDLVLDDRFAQIQRDTFDAEVASLDFRDSDARDVINAWFSERTAERIPRLLDRLPERTRLVLGNALYVKGQWLTPFDPDRTRPQAFHHADGQVTEVAMMRQDVGDALYREGADYQALRLPFSDPDYDVFLALPDENASVGTLLAESADQAALPSVLTPNGFKPTAGLVVLPRFEVNAGGDLGAVLRELGLFQSQDYGRMAAEPLEFGPVVHRVAFAVDEHGAEAAAATAVIGLRSAHPPARFELVFDRPFLLGLQHRPSGVWLFLGRIGAP